MSERAMNRTTTSPLVCSRAILRRTRPNAKCIIARQLPKYFIKLHLKNREFSVTNYTINLLRKQGKISFYEVHCEFKFCCKKLVCEGILIFFVRKNLRHIFFSDGLGTVG